MMSSSARATSPAQTRKLWVDCDAGVDDAQGLSRLLLTVQAPTVPQPICVAALLVALTAPNVDIVGISAVHGNVVGSPLCNTHLLVLLSVRGMPLVAWHGMAFQHRTHATSDHISCRVCLR